MTPDLVVKLPTDQLWNKKNEEQRYAILVDNADTEKAYADLSEIPELEYTDDEGNRKTVIPKEDQHKLRNTRGISVEVADGEATAYIRGIGLFEELENGEFRLSNRGEELKRRFNDEEEGWKSYLAELVVRYFLRTRTVLYYLGRGLALESAGYQRFTGDQLLVGEGVKYGVYHTDIQNFSGTPYNGAFTFSGLYSKLQESIEEADSDSTVNSNDLSWINDLYAVEFEIVASDFEDGLYVTEKLELIKERLMGQIASEELDPQHLDDIQEDAEEILQEYDDLKTDHRPITYVPNLLLQANLDNILGPELWAEIEAKTDFERSEFDQLTLKGAQKSEPEGGNIITTIRHSLRLLLKENLLSEIEEDDRTVLVPNRGELETVLSEEQFTSLIEDVYQSKDQSFLEAFKTEYGNHQSDTGWVVWKELVESLCAEYGMTETEVADNFVNLEQSGVIRVSDTEMGLRSSPDGPPGYKNNPKVVFEFKS